MLYFQYFLISRSYEKQRLGKDNEATVEYRRGKNRRDKFVEISTMGSVVIRGGADKCWLGVEGRLADHSHRNK